MRIHICAVGRMRGGPERDLVDVYLSRFEKTGRSLGLRRGDMIEIADRRGGGKAAEAELLSRSLPDGARVWALDERGQTLSSREFADQIRAEADAGQAHLAICIGGADGFDAPFLNRSAKTISLGRMVWPHKLVRVMLAEQLYRASALLAGHPYHRD